MSTPTTAALSHYNHYPYSHHAGGYTPAGASASYRAVAANSMLPPPAYASNVVGLHHLRGLSNPHHPHPASVSSTVRPEPSQTSEMPPSIQAQTTPTSASKKRRRSREPDWNEFYKNGLPKEIIVIDDTPEPDVITVKPPPLPQTAANGTGTVNGVVNGVIVAPEAATATRTAKRRKRDSDVIPYDPVYQSQQSSNHDAASTQKSSSSAPSDHTGLYTEPTSLSSNGTYDDGQTSLRRKRTRRATEAKRREALELLHDTIYAYRPPPYPPKKAAEVSCRLVREPRTKALAKVDDEDGHYIVIPDTDLTDKYKIVKVLGQGTFGKVVQARDISRGKLVAIKIIRSVQKYRDASKIELRVLQTLKLNDEENRNRCIHLRDCFDYRGHICIVMDLLGQSVFDFLKSTSFVPFPNSQIQNFARQLFTSVAYLHDVNLIHTDLKPENILLCDDSYQTFTYNKKIPSSSTTLNRQATQRRVLLSTDIRLIDFGSATFQDEYHSSVVSTRHYRAPEIILGLGWTFPCDIWSIGCILIEFFTGDALFQTHDNLEHLAMMEAVVGSRIDTHLVQAVNRIQARSGQPPPSKFFKRLRLDYPGPETQKFSKKFVKAMKKLDEIIPTNSNSPSVNQFMKNFLDLLRKIFVYDPSRRITAKQALQHPWFADAAPPDDGTEAAKIRADRIRTATHIS